MVGYGRAPCVDGGAGGASSWRCWPPPAACSGDDDASGADPDQAGLGSIVAALRALPPRDGDDGSAQWVWGDLEKAAELAGATSLVATC